MWKVRKWLLPRFEKVLGYYRNSRHAQERFDERMDLLSKLLALYPTADVEDLKREFGYSASQITQIANYYGVKKTKDARKEICRKSGMSTPQSRAFFFNNKLQKTKKASGTKKDNN